MVHGLPPAPSPAGKGGGKARLLATCSGQTRNVSRPRSERVATAPGTCCDRARNALRTTAGNAPSAKIAIPRFTRVGKGVFLPHGTAGDEKKQAVADTLPAHPPRPAYRQSSAYEMLLIIAPSRRSTRHGSGCLARRRHRSPSTSCPSCRGPVSTRL